MNGIELANAMGKESIKVPIAMMTGNPNPDLKSKLPKGTRIFVKPLGGAVLEGILAGV